MLPTLGAPTLTAVINNAGHYAETVDLEALQITSDALTKSLLQQRESWPDVFGITVLSVAAQGAKETVQAIRAAGFDGRVIIGGVHATLAPQECLDWGADLVVIGECEGNIVELLESGATGIHAGAQMPIEDIPAPDWDHFSPAPRTYTGNTGILHPNPGVSMWTRGCPYSCIFCSNLVFSPQATRYRPPANIEAEMKELKRHGCERIFIYDDELVGTKLPDGWMQDVADRIAPLEFIWITQGRCSEKYITPELMRDVKRAGCKAIFWGIESFSPKVLRAIKKHTSPEDIWHTLRVAKDAGIENGAFTMIGNYQETTEDLDITVSELGKAFNQGLIDYRQTTFCTAMPGTEYKRIQEREGWYIPEPNSGRQTHIIHNTTPWLNAQEINYYMNKFAEVCPVGM